MIHLYYERADFLDCCFVSFLAAELTGRLHHDTDGRTKSDNPNS
jgi:hypothetical protein